MMWLGKCLDVARDRQLTPKTFLVGLTLPFAVYTILFRVTVNDQDLVRLFVSLSTLVAMIWGGRPGKGGGLCVRSE